MYSLFKQATIGKNTTKAPSRMQFVERAKWFVLSAPALRSLALLR